MSTPSYLFQLFCFRTEGITKPSKKKQTNKQTQFKSSDDLVKSETNCNDVFLKNELNKRACYIALSTAYSQYFPRRFQSGSYI